MIRISIERANGYEFRIRVRDTDVASFTSDEAPPLGKGRSPSPEALLGAAVGSCLSASLLFCLKKARVDVDSFGAEVGIEHMRNERGRLRIGSIQVALSAHVPPEQRQRYDRCRELFEDFCTVTESVRSGIPVEVTAELNG